MANPDVIGARKYADEYFANLPVTAAELDGTSEDKPYTIKRLKVGIQHEIKNGGYEFSETVALNIKGFAENISLFDLFIRHVIITNVEAVAPLPAVWSDIVREIISGKLKPPAQRGRPYLKYIFRDEVFSDLAANIVKKFDMPLHRSHSPSGPESVSACDIIEDAYRNYGGSPPSANTLYKVIAR